MSTPKLRWFSAIASNFLLVNACVAADWTLQPEVFVQESYSDNLLASPVSQVKDDGFVTEVSPSIQVTAEGRRLQLKGEYTLQGLYYSSGDYGDVYHNRFALDADSELVEDWLYLGVDGTLGQQQLSTSGTIAADNLTPTATGRGDVQSTVIVPRIYHEFARDFLIDAEFSEERVRYEGSAVDDARLKDANVYVNSIEGLRRLGWGLGYNRSQRWSADSLSSEQESVSGNLDYRLTSSVKANLYGGKEEGLVTGATPFSEGSYWSAGATWSPTPSLSLELAKGDSDEQGSLFLRPTSRTALSVSYVNRDVGLRPSTNISGTFSHYHKKTKFELMHTKEITSDAVLVEVGKVNVLDGKGGFETINLFGVTDEEFVRNYTQADFSYISRKNEIHLQLQREQRDYSVTFRQGITNGAIFDWTHHFSKRSSIGFEFMSDVLSEVAVPKIEKQEFTLELNKSIGRRTTLASSLRHVTVDQNDINKDYDENRLSVSIKIAL
ncbi:TIGR03016 family PEP-CTERM system-associated outer membrane protein [Pseudomonadota bacterium]